MRATVALASAQSRILQRRLTLSSSKFKRSLRSESQRSHYAPLWIVTVAADGKVTLDPKFDLRRKFKVIS